MIKAIWTKDIPFEQIKPAIQKSLQQSTQLVRWQAIQNAPVLTWQLRRSITTEIKDYYWIVWTNLPYWKVREFHNRKNPQTKFYMYRALNENVYKIQTYFQRNITKIF